MKLEISEKTYNNIINNKKIYELLALSSIKCVDNNTTAIIDFSSDSTDYSVGYFIAHYIYTELPEEQNYWLHNSEKYPITDANALRLFLMESKKADKYLLSAYRLNNILKDKKINSLKDAKALAEIPFSGILPFGGIDYLYFNIYDHTKVKDLIDIESPNFHICNRYIKHDFKISKGNIEFENCIIDGDIEISCPEHVSFSQCIIPGTVNIYGAKNIEFSFSHIGQVCLYNSELKQLIFEFSKVYRLVLHSSLVRKFRFNDNLIVEPYITGIKLPENISIDMNQFVAKNIGCKTIKRIIKSERPRIKEADSFFLSYMIDNPVKSISAEEITYDMMNLFLTHGNLSKEHNLFANLMYERAYSANNGWRRLFVILTGSFYKPLRWVIYLMVATMTFALLYAFFPQLCFVNVITGEKGQIDIWTALYYSICQIIGSNPTTYLPEGVTQIISTLHVSLNTALIASISISLTKKYLRQ